MVDEFCQSGQEDPLQPPHLQQGRDEVKQGVQGTWGGNSQCTHRRTYVRHVHHTIPSTSCQPHPLTFQPVCVLNGVDTAADVELTACHQDGPCGLQGHLDLLCHVLGEGTQELCQNREDLSDKAKLSSRRDLVIAGKDGTEHSQVLLGPGQEEVLDVLGEGEGGGERTLLQHVCGVSRASLPHRS